MVGRSGSGHVAPGTGAKGDSGAPGFELSNDEATLYGIHWGRDPAGAAFSWPSKIEIEDFYGNLITHN